MTTQPRARASFSPGEIVERWGDHSPTIDVDVLTGPTSTGLCKVAYGARVFDRHIDLLEPLNDTARNLLGKGDQK